MSSPYSPSLSARQPLIGFLSLDLPVLDISCRWHHRIRGLLRLASFA